MGGENKVWEINKEKAMHDGLLKLKASIPCLYWPLAWPCYFFICKPSTKDQIQGFSLETDEEHIVGNQQQWTGCCCFKNATNKKTIPYDAVLDVRVVEPGSTIGLPCMKPCGCAGESQASSVQVQTAATGIGLPELVVPGVEDAEGFHKYVLQKRKEAKGGVVSSQPGLLPAAQSAGDKIRELKTLLEDGIISEKEFEEKKKKLLESM